MSTFTPVLELAGISEPWDAERPPGMSASTPALELAGISKRFGAISANRSIDLTVRSGEIHALLGENGAGKSTLVNIVHGLVRPDAGTIAVDGRRVSIGNPREALRAGIGVVHQHFKLVATLTAAENIALVSHPRTLRRLDLRRVRARLMGLEERFGLGVGADAYAGDLSLAGRQRLEVLKLLYSGTRLMILDEPSAVLNPEEWQSLAAALRSFAAEGKAIVFITHKLQEVLDVADRCTVLRDGRVVGRVAGTEATAEGLARMMVGRDVSLRAVRAPTRAGRTVLQVRGLSAADEGRPCLGGVDIEVREGEILGVAGVDGNGQHELVEILAGIRGSAAGSVLLDGVDVTNSPPHAFIDAGGAVIPEDRHRSALAVDLSVSDNLMCKQLAGRPYARHGVVNHRATRTQSVRLIETFRIRGAGPDVPIWQLSGGNQQMVVLARELHRRPRLLIAAQPTRGLDIGAIEFVHERLLDFRARGGAILLVSSELDEVLTLADRVAVMVRGRIVQTLDAAHADAHTVGLLMAGGR